jgi:hypothetical protein
VKQNPFYPQITQISADYDFLRCAAFGRPPPGAAYCETQSATCGRVWEDSDFICVNLRNPWMISYLASFAG